MESWLDCLKYLKKETAKPKRLGLLAPVAAALDGKEGKEKPAYSGLSVLLMTVSAAACYLLFKPSAPEREPALQMNLALNGTPRVKQDLPHHPIFAAALERILVDIQPLRYPELLQDALPAPEVERPIPTDTVESAKVDRNLIDAARDLLLQRTFALPSLLSFQFLTGEMTPASAMTKVLSAQQEMERKLEGILIDRWMTGVRESRHSTGEDADTEWLDYMFASPFRVRCIWNAKSPPMKTNPNSRAGSRPAGCITCMLSICGDILVPRSRQTDSCGHGSCCGSGYQSRVPSTRANGVRMCGLR